MISISHTHYYNVVVWALTDYNAPLNSTYAFVGLYLLKAINCPYHIISNAHLSNPLKIRTLYIFSCRI